MYLAVLFISFLDAVAPTGLRTRFISVCPQGQRQSADVCVNNCKYIHSLTYIYICSYEHSKIQLKFKCENMFNLR